MNQNKSDDAVEAVRITLFGLLRGYLQLGFNRSKQHLEYGGVESDDHHWVGFDVGKACHWLCVLDDAGEVLLHRQVDVTQGEIEAALAEID